MARHWAELLTDKVYDKLGGSLDIDTIGKVLEERINLYIPKPDGEKKEKLEESYRNYGVWSDKGIKSDPKEKASSLQGMLSRMDEALGPNEVPVDDYMGVFKGFDLLKKAGAVISCEHPAVYHGKGKKYDTYEEYDNEVLFPLIERGLHMIGAYAYDPSFRDEANSHYRKIAQEHGLLFGGGTDYHADGRSKLDSIKVPLYIAKKILSFFMGSSM